MPKTWVIIVFMRLDFLSVSAVTFVTAVQTLENQGVPYGGHMAAAMALMESPAIILAVVLANSLRQKQASGVALQAGGVAALGGPAAPAGSSVGKILHESFTDGAQLLLLGAMVIGLVTGEAGKEAMAPFSVDLFKGMLAFFLLDMGLLAARNLPQVRGQSPWLLAYAVIAPVVGRMGERVVIYLEHLGRVEGKISRQFQNGFAIQLLATRRKMDKLASALTWLANRHELGLPEDRRHERVLPRQTGAILQLPDGREIGVRIIDVSLSGAALSCTDQPPLDTRVTIGGTPAKVVRHFEGGVAVEFTRQLAAHGIGDHMSL